MDLIQRSIDIASSLTPAQWCQSFFVLSAGLILFIQALPQDVRSALMDYGPRRPNDAKQASGKPEAPKQSFKAIRSFLKTLTNYGQVPHSWFLHFYIISVSFSTFWAWQYIQKGSVMRTIATLQDGGQESSMSLEQVFVAWLFMALQGSRRLYESLCVSKLGSSPMWFVHWALGLGYYTAMSVSVWIEGSSMSPISKKTRFSKLTRRRRNSRILGFTRPTHPSPAKGAISLGTIRCGMPQAKPMPQVSGKPQKVHTSKRRVV